MADNLWNIVNNKVSDKYIDVISLNEYTEKGASHFQKFFVTYSDVIETIYSEISFSMVASSYGQE